MVSSSRAGRVVAASAAIVGLLATALLTAATAQAATADIYTVKAGDTISGNTAVEGNESDCTQPIVRPD